MSEHQRPSHWTDQQSKYGITSIVEFAKTLKKDTAEVHLMIQKLGLRNSLITTDDPNLRTKLLIRQLLQDHKRFLPNGWLVGLNVGQLMVRSLSKRVIETDTWIEEEINSVPDAIVRLHELTPLLSV